jgi:pimeloyl-ACP methyl ester carboxylesterase
MSERVRPQKSTNVRFFLWPALGRAASFSPALGARLLERAFVSTRRHEAPERERAWMASGERIRFESQGRRLEAWRFGTSGPAVALVHGWEGRGAQLGAFIEPLLERGFRVVTYDAPGHGASEGNRSSLVEMAQALRDAGLALGPFHGAVAHSAGAAATSLAIRNGASIERLVYLAPPADLGAYLPRVAAALGIGEKAVLLARKRIAERLGFEWAEVAHDHLAKSMETPVLVIHDADDTEIDVEDGIHLASLWRGARVEITSGLGHRRILRDERVVSRTVSFLVSQAEMVGTAAAPSEPSSAEASTTRSFPPAFAR